MKKTIFVALMTCVIGMNANAQILIGSDYDSPTTATTVSQTKADDNEIEQSQGGFDLQYHGIEHGWGLGVSYVFNYFVLGLDALWGETNDIVDFNKGMEIYLGGNYRYHVTKQLYIEGRVMGCYYYWSTKIKTGQYKSEENEINKGFIGFSPRIGIDFGGWGISGGYRWDYVDFKFDKDHKVDRFNVGISIGI